MENYEKDIEITENEINICNYIISILVFGRHEYGMPEARADLLKIRALKMLFDMVEAKENYWEILMKRKREDERGTKNDAL